MYICHHLQCDIRGAVLHLRHPVGPRAVHAVRNTLHRVRNPSLRDGLYLSGTDVLPALRRGLSLVVAIHLQCRVCYVPSYICVLCKKFFLKTWTHTCTLKVMFDMLKLKVLSFVIHVHCFGVWELRQLLKIKISRLYKQVFERLIDHHFYL